MHHALHPAQVVLALCRLALYPLDFCDIRQAICLADGVNVLFSGYIYVEELAADAAVYLLISFLL